jgi:hypothetical protein
LIRAAKVKLKVDTGGADPGSVDIGRRITRHRSRGMHLWEILKTYCNSFLLYFEFERECPNTPHPKSSTKPYAELCNAGRSYDSKFGADFFRPYLATEES